MSEIASFRGVPWGYSVRPRAAPAGSALLARSRERLREDVQVGLHVPLADGGDELHPLVVLVMVEDPVHVAGQRRLDDLVGGQRLQRLAERLRDAGDLLARGHGVVNVPLLGRAWVQGPV